MAWVFKTASAFDAKADQAISPAFEHRIETRRNYPGKAAQASHFDAMFRGE
jgi:hypothetical protein